MCIFHSKNTLITKERKSLNKFVDWLLYTTKGEEFWLNEKQVS